MSAALRLGWQKLTLESMSLLAGIVDLNVSVLARRRRPTR
jgi:hypothetical protein